MSYLQDLARLAIDPTSFRRHLAAEMERRGMSQRTIAGRAGVNHSTVSRILSGRNEPSLVTAIRLARVIHPRDWPGAKIAREPNGQWAPRA